MSPARTLPLTVLREGDKTVAAATLTFPESRTWTCRWTRVDGPVIAGRATSTVVWICEHPYRTMLLEPPPPGACGHCPAARRAREQPSVDSPRATPHKSCA